MNQYGFVRVTACTLRTEVANPEANGSELQAALERHDDSDIVLFPELCLTGYTCGDLFTQSTLQAAARDALRRVARATRGHQLLVLLGMPLAVENALYNVAVAIHDGRIVGVVPKRYLPTYQEFYEARWFRPAREPLPPLIALAGQDGIPFGTDVLFDAGNGAVIGVELCEDLWAPLPPSTYQALAGATILTNLSGSNETIAKSAYRRQLVLSQSGRTISAYAYAGAGPTESTTDLVFAGHCLIAESARMLAESAHIGDGAPPRRDSHAITADVDVQRLLHDRRSASSFNQADGPPLAFRRIALELRPTLNGLQRFVPGQPFVPAQNDELQNRCAEIFAIQCAGLAKRIEMLPEGTTLNIGVSGGLDSTLALLVAVQTCDLLKRDRSSVHGLTMPGFGTSQQTLTNALDLMGHLGVTSEQLDIRPLALDSFRTLRHAPFGIDPDAVDLDTLEEELLHLPAEKCHDLVFENVQARLRTFLLMSRGFVLGTGDLSEIALGWSTYNADHMSMYNPNCSIPKTLVRFLVRHVARQGFPSGPVRETLLSIAETPISPELLPKRHDGQIAQATEDTIGPYELHDFFLYHMVRCGYAPAKILYLSAFADFSRPFPSFLVRDTLRTFLTRFFQQQYKRSCIPDGPKVGTVSLSPRGDWRMPSDAQAAAWLADLDDAQTLDA